MQEIYKTIHYGDGTYQVSNLGNVRRVTQKEVRILSQSKTGKGYYCVGILGKAKNVHRLVAETFKPVPSFKNLVVNHIDGNKLNNCITNLEWVTQKYNIFHSFMMNKHYIFTDTDREKSKNNRLNAIRKKVRCLETQVIYESISSAARLNNLKVQNICKCCKYKTRTTGGFHWEYAI